MISNLKFKISNSQRGVSLVISFLIMAVMLAIVLSVSVMILNETKMVANLGNSVSSFYAAQSGAEKTLYFDRKIVPPGAIRGICNTCNSCGASDCVNCTTTSLTGNGSDGCNPLICNNCQITYTTNFNNRSYTVNATMAPGPSAPDENFGALTAVTFGNGVFVAVSNSDGSRSMISYDGQNWGTVVTAANNAWEAVTYGNGLFVAVASSGVGNRVMTSPDGITWTSQTSAGDYSWKSVTYGAGKYVAVSEEANAVGYIMTSSDGIIWSMTDFPSGAGHNGVAYGNGLFVAVGDGWNMTTSPDGITWTTSSASPHDWYGVTYGINKFVAVGQDGVQTCTANCSNSANWAFNGSVGGIWRSVAYGNGKFVAMGLTGTIYSSDGLNWTEGFIPWLPYQGDGYYGSVTYGNGLFVAVQDSQYAATLHAIYSLDGVNWNTATTQGSALTINSEGYYRESSRAVQLQPQ